MRMALRTTFVSYVALVLPRGFKNDVYFMCSALVCHRGLKERRMLHAYGFKNDVCFMCSACFASWKTINFSWRTINFTCALL